MKKNVLDFEPELALFVDNQNPLKHYHSIINFSINNQKDHGKIFFEINEYLFDKIKLLLKKYDVKFCNFIKDIDDKNRFIILSI